jgi:serine phosphatase RsbU (regulator of sigma subunit)
MGTLSMTASRVPPPQRGPRVIRWLFGWDLCFKLFIGLSLIASFGIDDTHDRVRAALLMALLAMPLVGAWVFWLWRRLGTVDRGRREDASDEEVRRATETAYKLPLRVGCVWAVHWIALAGLTLIALDADWPFEVEMAPLSVVAFVLFEATMLGGALSLAYSLTAWLLGPTAGELSVKARQRRLTLRSGGLSLRTQLVGMALALCLTPMFWMGNMAYMSHHGATDEGFLFTFFLYVVAISIWGPLCAWFLGHAVTTPVRRVADALDEVARAGRGADVARVPVFQRDEVGRLADRANAMIDVLETTGRDLDRAMKELETRERARQELAIGAHIQTSILPRTFALDGLEMFGQMVTATEVGGDYFDVLPADDGGWLAIGDVAGHGLAAGMIMMMAQSAVAALVRRQPDATPGQILQAVNAVLYENVRRRMGHDDYLTLTLLRYYPDGRVVYAGAHEDLLVCRSSSGRCEVVPTTGAWMGVAREVGTRLPEAGLVLRPGDLLVLQTDGISEARDSGGRLFGGDRLVDIVEREQARPVQQVVESVFAEVRAWCQEPEDDQTLMVMRYQGRA